jgi:hypothetical protein
MGNSKRRMVAMALVALLLIVAVAGSYGVYLAGDAGMLPWQTEPTRIAVTPFAGIEGFAAPATPTEPPR